MVKQAVLAPRSAFATLVPFDPQTEWGCRTNDCALVRDPASYAVDVSTKQHQLSTEASQTCAIPYHFDTLAHMQLWDRVVERAAEQHGYVTTRDARELDIDPTQLRLMAARGRLERVSRGVYRVSLLPRTQHDDLAEAVAWTLGRGVVSHESALVLHGISDVSPSRIQLSVLRDNHPRGAGGQLYRLHRRTLHPSDITELDDIPVTTVQRTIRDCLADGTDPYQLRLAVDQAEAGGSLRRSEAEVLRAEIDDRSASTRA